MKLGEPRSRHPALPKSHEELRPEAQAHLAGSAAENGQPRAPGPPRGVRRGGLGHEHHAVKAQELVLAHAKSSRPRLHRSARSR